MAKKTYVLDTSVCLTDAGSIRSFENNDIIIPLKVLEEIDNHKNRQDGVGINARNIINVKIRVNNRIKFKLLYDSSNSLSKKIKLEQFRNR